MNTPNLSNEEEYREFVEGMQFIEELLNLLVHGRPPHSHRCEPCNKVWGHDTRKIKVEEEYDKAHMCPNCGACVTEIYMRQVEN